MATQENIEYLALLKCKVELTSEISEDPLSVSTALVAKGLIPESLHRSVESQTKNDEIKATELINKVTNKIKTYPARFAEFLEVLHSSKWLEDVWKTLITAYDELKRENMKSSDTEDVTITSTENSSTNATPSSTAVTVPSNVTAFSGVLATVGTQYEPIVSERDPDDDVDDTTIISDDKADVVNALTDVQSRYYEIGTQLRLKALDTVKNRSTNDTIAMGEVVEEWLKGNYYTEKLGPPTWKMLVKVVANPNGGNNNSLAKKIANEHPASSTNATPSSTTVTVPSTVTASSGASTPAGAKYEPIVSERDSEKFPYLKTPDLSDAQRDKLKRRLKMETEEIVNHFAVLVGKTMLALNDRGISIGQLTAIIEHSYPRNRNKLIDQLEKVTILSDVFRVLYNFWSFFDFKILEVIINSCCHNLKPDFDEYVSNFKKYCRRRVCEVPDDSYPKEMSESERKKTLYIQIDQNFIDEIERMKMEDLRVIVDHLGKILETEFCILKIEDGSIILTFHCLHELGVLFPLSSKQEEELQEIGVVRIYSEEQEYYQQFSPINGEKSRFPYLKTPNLSDTEREILMGQLKNEMNEIKKSFAVLIERTLLSLKKHEVSMGELKSLLKQLNAPKLSNLLKKVTDISKAFEVLHRWWSFLDFKILGVIIRSFCFDINRDFEEYLSKFKEYCNRRVCEVPDDSYSTKLSKSEQKKNLHIQIDQLFIDEVERLKMSDLKDRTDTLGKILDTDFRILKIRGGSSITLTFHCLHELDVIFPLCSKQEEELQEIGVRKIYSEEKDLLSLLPTKKEEHQDKMVGDVNDDDKRLYRAQVLGKPDLLSASMNGCLNEVKVLLKHNRRKVNLKNSFGFFPLEAASFFGHVDVVKLLLEKKAQVDLQNDKGSSSLIMASLNALQKHVG